MFGVVLLNINRTNGLMVLVTSFLRYAIHVHIHVAVSSESQQIINHMYWS